MSEQEAYEAGLRALGLFEPGWCEGCDEISKEKHDEWLKFGIGHKKAVPDLRIDLAFAWRVLEAFRTESWKTPDLNAFDHAMERFVFTIRRQPTVTLTDAIYDAVVALGREQR